MGGVIGEDEADEATDNVCGHHLEHTEPDGLGCCKRCGAELEPEDEDGAA